MAIDYRPEGKHIPQFTQRFKQIVNGNFESGTCNNTNICKYRPTRFSPPPFLDSQINAKIFQKLSRSIRKASKLPSPFSVYFHANAQINLSSGPTLEADIYVGKYLLELLFGRWLDFNLCRGIPAFCYAHIFKKFKYH